MIDVETAREIEADEDKERFEAALEKVATHKPKGKKSQSDKPKKAHR
jgi:hypothetical protein